MNESTVQLFVCETARAELVAKNAWEAYQHTKDISEVLIEQSGRANAAAEKALLTYTEAQLLAKHTQELYQMFVKSMGERKLEPSLTVEKE
jgi:hypothetical protein